MTENGAGKLALALSKAQKAFPAITKGRTAKIVGKKKDGTPYNFEYQYANLADTLDAVREPLADNELAVSQPIVCDGNSTLLRTVLMHSSGEQLDSLYPLPDGLTAQEMGSAISYARRYSLTSLLGIATEDDDGAQATESGKAPKRKLHAAKAGSSGRSDTSENMPTEPTKPDFGERQKEIMDLPAALGLTVEQAQAVWKDVVGTNVGIVDASPENLDQFEMALRGTSEAQAAAFGTEQK